MLAATAALAVLLPLAACTPDPAGPAPESTDDGRPRSGTVRVLASSELADMEPLLEEARKATGITVRPTWTGTLDAVERLASGKADGAFDAVWLSSNDYLRLNPEAARRVTSETPLMTSPVALGVRPATVRRLGWDPERVSWAQVHRAVADGKLTYGMTDPKRSNSGFSALISVASGLSGAQAALTDADVRAATPKLKEFFAGQRLTSGSSGWLATAYTRRSTVDALINYESVLLSLNRGTGTSTGTGTGTSTEPAEPPADTGTDAEGRTPTGTEGPTGTGTDLTVIRPRDGVVTADYPLSTLTAAAPEAKDAVRALTEHLRSPAVQREITERTLRRPVVASARPAEPLSPEPRRELPFPGSRSVADGLLSAYEHQLRRPSRTVYVLDTSGSMKGKRLEQLKSALTGLTGDFRQREEVTLLPFGSAVKRVRTHTVDPADPAAGPAAIRADTAALTAEGNTAIYSSLAAAYDHLGPDTESAFTSIVLMTDGENTAGRSAADFTAFYRSLPPARQVTPVFPIVFGDSDRSELDRIAALTGGRLFDGTKEHGPGSLEGAFEEIRGYQ
ncbi:MULTISPECIES: VWA domain-containing protein [Streptomyces]|uniref:vWA domain-containing protein n=1 Tax=Streptomyces TaxID=1883 RepID=UPI00103C994D|nr:MULTISPECIES: VWA domain-containing protein [Streptomyces]MBT3075936.1 VWA domain-containing protein [Streptomyces sp. COG21]MBT3079549.1 VWA domain-containing protein [Streptomyces sp. COG20]MBT3086628.1 VWA domain-containing protein [Streptomyces sp. CYG21]MBT3100553.1 VWA domain-containing protein [Streptomyces sp. CBG30]MBT3106583.1 VWA domain-containing protein [Streptomyces sp. COG19]